MESSHVAKKATAAAAVHFTLELSGGLYILRVEDGHHKLCYSRSFSEPVAAMRAAERFKEQWHFAAGKVCA